MFELTRKTMLLGMGLATLTREKVEKTIIELIKKGEISEKEGEELVDELIEKSRKYKKDLEEKVEEIVADTLKKLNIPTRDELTALNKKIERMEKSQEGKE